MSLRILTAYLTLAALLFGNVAGWVHVGCCSHESGCCSGEVTKAEAIAADAHNHGGHSCWHADHASHHKVDDPAGESESETPARPHDDDQCSVCQSFFASRHAVVLWKTVTAVETLAVSHDVVLVDDVFSSGTVIADHWVRGPPSV